jgi:hypothetical protein
MNQAELRECEEWRRWSLFLCCRRARSLVFTILFQGLKVEGENMTFTMSPINAAGAASTVSVVVSPVKADATPSLATLSGISFTSSDPTVFSVASDPATPNGGIVTAVANGTAILTSTATATEPDGTTTEVITGAVTVVIATPPPAPAAALVFTFGTPA